MRNGALVRSLLCGLLALVPRLAHAQSDVTLRTKISQLFIFGSGDQPLHLGGTADPSNPTSVQVHGDHFVPSAVAENGSLIGFITSAISASVGDVPIATTSGGVTFRFEGGIPVKSSLSSGPIFAEQAQTLGRGRAAVGINRTAFRFSSLRGVPMDNISLIFTHQNVNFPGCSEANGGDCAKMGIPNLENDIMPFRLNLALDVAVTTLYATFGVFDRVDVGVVIPLVNTNLHGESNAQIIPFGGPTAVHFFDGTPDNPVLSASRTVDGSSFGLGDVATRVKIALHESENSAIALLGEARFGTGSPDDLLGSGAFSARGLAVVSGHLNAFSPHLNLGYFYHARQNTPRTWNDAILMTGGFDQLVSDKVTIAADVLSEIQVGQSALQLPGPVTYDAPFHRVIDPTTIPNIRDDIFNGSFGARVLLWPGWSMVLNGLFPLNRGGLRANIVYTTGLEVTF